ncbi:MAG TPA: AraC family ligand binding domain-containing protein [Steroidobacteraceae bacterium]|nr:AraC family ligand binding domain-containing protein [Steroidobacteraceae bacterium]
MSVRHFRNTDARFHQYLDRQIFVGDVVDSSISSTMSAGYYRNLKKGDSNDWIVTYDEVLVVTRGALTVRSGGAATTARPGEIIFLTKGTRLSYESAEDDTEVVYVTFPHWFEAHARSEHAALLDAYQPACP